MDGQIQNPLQSGQGAISLDSAVGILRSRDEQQTAPPPAAEAPREEPQNTAPEAEPAAETPSEQPDDATPAEPDLPAIEPPASWKAADKELFKTLPREAQQRIAEREREREQATNRALQEAAEKRKATEAERTAYENERQRYAQQLNTLVPLLQQQFQGKWANIDWVKLARDNPAEAVALREERDAEYIKLQHALAEQHRLRTQEQETQKAQLREVAQREFESLLDKRPELKDRSALEKFHRDIRDYAVSIGYKPEEYDNNIDHRNVLILEKAMLYDKAQKAKAEAVAKPVPKVQTPGTSQGKADKAAEERAALLKRAERTGDLRDYARLLRT